ncbi:T-cell receptor-associated transmembrane adapter 1-like [Acipenser ruthenus]|uniref:T-cell receptor-associated transmembrane adapter 1-like n=1 Tax=Acipenser ruthenus TaxID=7906 RepID=UPI002741CB3E|nr:T-cell receptor-associated transmembrane adapter 1-like [Acipenser ruthenus]
MTASSCNIPWVIVSLTVIALIISICIHLLTYNARRKKEKQPITYRDCEPSFSEPEYIDENPIYGNINPEVVEVEEVPEVCYEQMNIKAPVRVQRERKAADEHSMCYASLELSAQKQHRKHRKKKNNSVEFLDTDMEEGKMPSRTNSMYLNSQQLAAGNGDEAIHEDPSLLLSMINTNRY